MSNMMRPRCGYEWMGPTRGRVCVRMLGHAGDHRSAGGCHAAPTPTGDAFHGSACDRKKPGWRPGMGCHCPPAGIEDDYEWARSFLWRVLGQKPPTNLVGELGQELTRRGATKGRQR